MAVQSFGPFDGAEEDWRSHTVRLGQYFITNQITGEKRKRAFLLSICGPQTYQLMRNILAPTLESSVIKLRTYTGEQLSVLGTLSVPVTYQDQHIKDLDLLVVKGDGPSLFGRTIYYIFGTQNFCEWSAPK